MADQPRPATRRQRASCLGIMIGGGLALVAMFAIVVMWSRRGQLPEVDSALHAREFQAWERVAPANYDIEINVTGRQPAVYGVQVRGGNVVSTTRNSQPLTPKDTWSVHGMFDTMDSDLINEAADQQERLSPNSPRVTVRASFDANWHYPAAYQRIEWGSTNEVEWRVTRFEVIDGPNSAE